MLLAEGKERFRNELRSSMRVMADDHSGGACSLGLQMDLGLMLQRGHDENYSDTPRQCPVQLDLLQPLMRPSDSSSGTPPDPSSTNNTTFSWQHHWNGSRTNSGSGYNDGEVETYSSGGHGTSPRGIDINQLPSTTECEEEIVLSTSSPSSIGIMKRGRQEKCFHEFDLERERACDLSSRGGSDDEDGGTTRKKLRLSKEQSALLEESFKDHITLSPKQKSALAKQLNLRPRQVEVWFQNRRARTKLKQTEVDCELLKQCCETLTEENTRLQKELQELRAIKAAAPRVMAHDFHMPLPAATLTMCPSCERVTTLDNQSVNFTKPKYPHVSHSPAAC